MVTVGVVKKPATNMYLVLTMRLARVEQYMISLILCRKSLFIQLLGLNTSVQHVCEVSKTEQQIRGQRPRGRHCLPTLKVL